MKFLIILFLCCKVLRTTAQFSNCSNRILAQLNDGFFDALRKMVSDGDLCKVSADGNKLGPYQISEEFYNDALDFDPTLTEGRWEFVWGKDSKNYSEEVIKSYLCKHGSIVQENTGRQLSIANLGAIYFGGSAESRRRENIQLGRQLAQLIHDGSKPNNTYQACDPQCNLHQCCIDGKCFCIDSITNGVTVLQCEEVTLNVRVTATGNKITVNYDVSENATCTCQLDSETPVTCNSGHMFNTVASGDHTVTVSCITTNLDTISRSVDVSVSETQMFTVTGRQQVSGNSVQVFFNSTLPATFQCRLDSNPPVTCVSGHTYPDLGLGSHRIQLIARLISNRRTQRTLRLPRFTIQLPTTTSPPPPPPPRFTAAEAQVFTNCSARLRFSADVPVTFRCRVNGGPWKPCSDGYLVSDLPPGTNEVEIEASTVQAPDAKTVVTATLNIRGQACSVLEIDCPVCNPSSIVGNNFTFTVNANKPNVEFLCSLNNRQPSPCNEGSVTYSNLRNRRNQLVTVTASSCNGETATKNITFSPKYNRRFCQVYTCGDGLVTTGSSARVTFLSDDPDATFRCKLDRQRRRSCESPLELSDLSSGSHRLDITTRCAINARGRRLRLRFSIS